MSPKAFATLAGAALVAVILAGWSIATRDTPLTATAVDQPLFPGLLDRLEQVARIESQTDSGVVTLRRDGDVWRVEQRDGFPADGGRVRAVARGLAALQIVEAKTAVTERLSRLELDEPGAEKAKGRRVTLKDAEGNVLAAAILGKTRYDLYGGGRGGIYVRRDGESQAWLAAGEVELPADDLGWIDTTIVDLPEYRVRKVTLGAGGPDPIVLSRADDTQDFSLDGVPEGRKADVGELSRVAATLASLTLQDVEPASVKPVPDDAPLARFETFDGQVVAVRLLVEGTGDAVEHWVRLTAEPPVAPAPAANTQEPSATETTDAAEAEPKPDPAAATARLAQRVDGWTFKVPRWVTDRLLVTRDDLLEAQTPATTPGS